MKTRYDALEELETKASEGPWASHEHGVGEFIVYLDRPEDQDQKGVVFVDNDIRYKVDSTFDQQRNDVQFIAAARNEVPRLIADVRALAEALEGVIRVADRATAEFDAARAALARIQGEAG